MIISNNYKRLLTDLIFLWLANSLLFLIGSNTFPSLLVLGNAKIGTIPAAILAGFSLMCVQILAKKIVKPVMNELPSEIFWFFMYWLVDGFWLWIIAHFNRVSGVGFHNIAPLLVFSCITAIIHWTLIHFFPLPKIRIL